MLITKSLSSTREKILKGKKERGRKMERKKILIRHEME